MSNHLCEDCVYFHQAYGERWCGRSSTPESIYYMETGTPSGDLRGGCRWFLDVKIHSELAGEGARRCARHWVDVENRGSVGAERTSSATDGVRDGYMRATYIVNIELHHMIKEIACLRRESQKDVMERAMVREVERYEDEKLSDLLDLIKREARYRGITPREVAALMLRKADNVEVEDE